MTGRDPVQLAVDLSHIATVRHAVAEFAAWHGLAGRPHADFVLAVNELVANAVQHGGGSGGATLWRTPEAVWCEVADQGPGLPPDHRDGYRLPPATAPGGRGLWLVHRLCDQVSITTGPTGTTVRVAKNVA
ncbi:MAG TPA: ATP-binding protein [Rugosimonospora sp.]|nr:ATP-binding protein [Rugosimonospora sp.]